MAPNCNFDRRLGTATVSAFFFLLNRFADDVGYISVALFLLFDEGGIVQAFVADLDFFFFGRVGLGVGAGRLLALLLGLRILERYKIRFGGLWHNALGLGRWGRPRGSLLRSRARRRCYRDDFTGIGRNHWRLIEVVKLTTGIGTDTLGAEIGFSHSQSS